ncbi:MAG: MetQ/NlpA family ABC transporter substrate-binding protein [Chloroflexi bacterium]|nr:MetQ/NlpA family ABC transporter substrate-binding protein [Chloroflexota bacterium]
MKQSFFFLALITFTLFSCSSIPPTSKTSTLKIAVIPVIDTLPIFVAQAEGLFEKNNIKVELIPVASAPERDQIMQAGQADGTLNETLAVMLFNKDKVQIQAVRYGLMATENSGHFFILSSAQSGINDITGLKGVEIGISQGTIIDYVTTRLLESQGFTQDEIKTIAVPKIPDRMALLASGELKAAVMPDPLAALAVQQGANIIIDDSINPKLGASVISFRKEFLDANPGMIKAFLEAIETAVTLINSDPGKYSNLLAEHKIVPQPLIGKYVIPKFPIKGVPSEAEWNDVLAWAKSRSLFSANISYADSVNPSFLP